jgi:hypothetical protein
VAGITREYRAEHGQAPLDLMFLTLESNLERTSSRHKLLPSAIQVYLRLMHSHRECDDQTILRCAIALQITGRLAKAFGRRPDTGPKFDFSA